MMSRKTWICILLTVLTALCLLAGCTDDNDTSSDTQSAASDAVSGTAESSSASSAESNADASQGQSGESVSSEAASDESEPSSETSSGESSEEMSVTESSKEVSEPDESSEEVSEPDESSEEVSEPDESSEEVSEPDESSEEVSEPDESSEEVSEPDESSEEVSEPDESSEEVSEPDESSEEVSEPEISVPEIGSGTESDPYLMIPDANEMSVTTVKIASGASVFYGIQRAGGKDLVINDPDAYVIYEGKRYDAENGAVSLRVETALASDFIEFEIGNNGSAGKSFVLLFSDPKGAQGNPESVDLSEQTYSVSLEAGDSDGYYFRYTAEKNGTVRFFMTASVDSVLTVTNNRSSAQRTTDSDGQTDENGWYYVEIDVQAGDELVIIVGAVPNRRGKYPATDITWKANYTA